MNELLFDEVTKWQEQTFGKGHPLAKLAHLKEELVELESDVANQAPGARLEFADCFLLLFGAASATGMDYEDICQAIRDKMEINYKRKWGKPNADGVINHIKI